MCVDRIRGTVGVDGVVNGSDTLERVSNLDENVDKVPMGFVTEVFSLDELTRRLET